MENITSKIPSVDSSSVLNQTKSFSLPGGMAFEPTYLQAGLIVFLIFLLILMLGQLRHRMVNWQLKGLFPGLFLGFGLAIILEGFLIISGHTVVTGLLGWENAPKPISNALDAGKMKLVDVLGVSDVAIDTSKSVENMSYEEIEDLKLLICK